MNDDDKPEGMPSYMYTLGRGIRGLNRYVYKIAIVALIVLGLLGWLAWKKIVWAIVLGGVLLTVLAGGFGVLVAIESRRRNSQDPDSDGGD